jgi:hypothetical protein
VVECFAFDHGGDQMKEEVKMSTHSPTIRLLKSVSTRRVTDSSLMDSLKVSNTSYVADLAAGGDDRSELGTLFSFRQSGFR